MLHVVYRNQTQSENYTLSPVVKILAYFSLFDYPLSRDEVLAFLPPGFEPIETNSKIDTLISEGNIFSCGRFLSLTNDPALAQRRIVSNQRAQELLKKAMRIGTFLSRFPFVTGVGISGSLSKNSASENADIDFFIVTNPNRLWIARTILHLYKKFMFIAGRQHYYCMNYFVDELALRIPDRNIYTAIETSTMIPVRGKGMKKFAEENLWAAEWIASYRSKVLPENEAVSSSLTKRVLEWFLSSNWLDSLLLKITLRRWTKKMSKGAMNHEGQEMQLQLGKHFARSNPGHFQEKLLNAYQILLDQLDYQTNHPISSAK
jgi:hypothetical protein